MYKYLSACIATFGLGLFSGNLLWNKPSQTIVVKQDEHKSGTIQRTIANKPDGSQHIDEVEKYVSDSKQYVSIIQAEKKNSIMYIPKYNFTAGSIYHSAAYTYENLGVYVSGNKSGLQEAGLVLKFSW